MSDEKEDVDAKQPSLDELFIMCVGSTFEVAKMLGFSKETLLRTLSEAWDINEEKLKEGNS